MKLTLTILIIVFSVICGCRKGNSVPGCIQTHIESFKNSSCEHQANVKEYKFQGVIVYTFDMGNCGADMTADVMDQNCNTIGYLGGFTGNTKINGVEFSTATYIRTIWSR